MIFKNKQKCCCGHRPLLNSGDRRAAFTLAEVLITLAVIGIIAAMTIPSLIQSYTNTMTETRLKKFYSVMNNAINLAKLEYGEPETWDDYFINEKLDDDEKVLNQTDATDAIFQKYLAPYLKISNKEKIIDKDNTERWLYYFADGSAFAYSGFENRDLFFYPHNPKKCITKSNQSELFGVCEFLFNFNPCTPPPQAWEYIYKKGLQPFLYNWDGNISSLYDDSTYGCRSGYGHYCTGIIQQNGWEIPDDYPRKIRY